MARAKTKPRTTRTTRVRGEWKPRFLEAFVRHGTVKAACEATGIGRRTVYDARQKDEAFALLFADAEVAVTESLEEEGIRRAIKGSDRLLEFFLKARRPERYSETHRMVHSGAVGVQPMLDPAKVEEELEAFGMPAAIAVAHGPDAVQPPEDT